MAFEKIKQDWDDMDPKFRWIVGALIVVAVGFLVVRSMAPDKPTQADAPKSAPMLGPDGVPIDPFKTRVLPDTPRNQGIEDIKLEVEQLRDEIAKLGGPGAMERRAAANATAAAAAASAASAASGAGSTPNPVASPFDLNATTPPRFDGQDGNSNAPGKAGGKGSSSGADHAPALPGDGSPDSAPLAPPAPQMKVWPADARADDRTTEALGGPVIPVNSALESVMLSGINARPSGSIGGAVGSVNSANKVGAPFVTRIKGDAIMPNGWRLSDIGDCFLGGSGIAILSTERAYVIADNLSCIAANGEVYEAPIKAYGLDVDGTLGIAGKVVSKQGSLLLQAALTGMASGLGAALSPSTLPSYNSNATSGSTTGVQFPNPSAVAQTAVGQGINQAAAQLSKFYLDYAKEVFPVVEVTSGTRVTWVLTESVELKRQLKKVALK